MLQPSGERKRVEYFKHWVEVRGRLEPFWLGKPRILRGEKRARQTDQSEPKQLGTL